MLQALCEQWCCGRKELPPAGHGQSAAANRHNSTTRTAILDSVFRRSRKRDTTGAVRDEHPDSPHYGDGRNPARRKNFVAGALIAVGHIKVSQFILAMPPNPGFPGVNELQADHFPIQLDSLVPFYPFLQPSAIGSYQPPSRVNVKPSGFTINYCLPQTQRPAFYSRNPPHREIPSPPVRT